MRSGVAEFYRTLLFSTSTSIWCSLSRRWRNDEKKSHGSKTSHRHALVGGNGLVIQTTQLNEKVTNDTRRRVSLPGRLHTRIAADQRRRFGLALHKPSSGDTISAAVRFRRFATSGSRAVPCRRDLDTFTLERRVCAFWHSCGLRTDVVVVWHALSSLLHL